MDLSKLKKIFYDIGCSKIYIKVLSANDNSKNQVYFGGNFEVLNILPISEIKNESPGKWEKERFKASIDFSWISEDGNSFVAPFAQLILYPKYPEVRFSGFLKGCDRPPSGLMTQRLSGRVLFFAVSNDGKVFGYVASPDSAIVREINDSNLSTVHGVFRVIELEESLNSRKKLLAELLRIYRLGWITSKRLNKNGDIMPCDAPNCGGYTLEAELGITPNGYSEPDFLGWEVKQFNVKNLSRTDSAVITLMTPEPTGGFYVDSGADAFIRRYGYADLNGKADRLNFGGIHKCQEKHPRTGLTLRLVGFDFEQNKIRNTGGKIALVDINDSEAAVWDFASLLKHWNKKHNQACYVPSLSEKEVNRKYKFGNNVILGTGTDFQFFLSQMASGNIYYDPGIKMENISQTPLIKKRSQFRIKSINLPQLYKFNEVVDLTQI